MFFKTKVLKFKFYFSSKISFNGYERIIVLYIGVAKNEVKSKISAIILVNVFYLLSNWIS
jgi:hypothetical protein